MSEHQCVKFGDMAQQITTKVNPKDTSLDTYVGLEHLDTGSLRINRRGTPQDVIGEKLRVCKGDIIFGKRRVYQRKVAIADFEGICSAHAMVLRPKEDIVDKDFFPFFMQSDRFMDRALQISVGSLSPTINWKTLAEQEFIIPSLPDQHQDASILWAAEDCIIGSERFLVAAERIKQLLITKLFTEGIEHSNFKLIKDIGNIPADWNIIKLKDCTADIIVPMRDKPKKFGGHIPWCRIEDFDGKFLYNSKSGQTVDEKTISDMRLKVFPAGTVICSCSASMGICAIAGNPLTTNQTFIGIVPDEKIYNEFLFYLLGYYSPRLEAQSTGTTIGYIPRKIFENFIIPLPPLPEQHQIASILTRCDETIAAARANVAAAKALKMKMINEMLSPRKIE